LKPKLFNFLLFYQLKKEYLLFYCGIWSGLDRLLVSTWMILCYSEIYFVVEWEINPQPSVFLMIKVHLGKKNVVSSTKSLQVFFAFFGNL
jgi:hypothetical protein